MSEKKTRYDDVIIGAGQAAAPLARSLAGAQRRVAIVEKNRIGGSCVNVACTPTKTLIASAGVAHLASRARDFGVETGPVSIDMARVRDRTKRVVARFREGLEKSLDDLAGVDVIDGAARFVDPHTIHVDDDGDIQRIQAERFYLDVGTRPRRPPIEDLQEVGTMTAADLLDLDEVPTHLVIVGAGPVGLELGQALRRLGSEVTLVERESDLLPEEEPEIARHLEAILKEEGIQLLLGTTVENATTTPAGGYAMILGGCFPQRIVASHVMMAIGEVPDTEGLHLGRAQVVVNDDGYVLTDERCRTSADHIYAMGDVRGAPKFTHVAYDDYRVVVDAELGTAERTVDDSPRLYVIFTDPELGRVGLTEAEAKAVDPNARAMTLPMERVARAVERGRTKGLLKAVVGSDDRIVGFSALGTDGGELMSMVQLAMLGGLEAATLADTMFAHPTLAESMNALFARG
jgi:pyruvate/2-oxoglutarate dehydrogenase complex dihydrolipoamide dehydrogenase (E3) component